MRGKKVFDKERAYLSRRRQELAKWGKDLANEFIKVFLAGGIVGNV